MSWESVSCPTCGFANAVGNDACWNCGQAFAGPATPADATCRQCKNAISRVAEKCHKCGAVWPGLDRSAAVRRQGCLLIGAVLFLLIVVVAAHFSLIVAADMARQSESAAIFFFALMILAVVGAFVSSIITLTRLLRLLLRG
jgi:uncharacterized membrane protein YvbJ